MPQSRKTTAKKTRQAVKGKNNRRAISRVVPVAYAPRLSRPAQPRQVVSARSTRYHHREFVSDIRGTNDLANLLSYIVTPRNSVLFPWLSVLSSNFERYVIHRLSLHFEPTVPTTSAGTCLLAWEPNADLASSATYASFRSWQFNVEKAVYQPVSLTVPGKEFTSSVRQRYLGDPSSVDPMYSSGRLYAFLNGPSVTGATSNGRLWIDYDIELVNPKLGNTSSVSATDFLAERTFFFDIQEFKGNDFQVGNQCISTVTDDSYYYEAAQGDAAGPLGLSHNLIGVVNDMDANLASSSDATIRSLQIEYAPVAAPANKVLIVGPPRSMYETVPSYPLLSETEWYSTTTTPITAAAGVILISSRDPDRPPEVPVLMQMSTTVGSIPTIAGTTTIAASATGSYYKFESREVVMGLSWLDKTSGTFSPLTPTEVSEIILFYGGYTRSRHTDSRQYVGGVPTVYREQVGHSSQTEFLIRPEDLVGRALCIFQLPQPDATDLVPSNHYPGGLADTMKITAGLNLTEPNGNISFRLRFRGSSTKEYKRFIDVTKARSGSMQLKPGSFLKGLRVVQAPPPLRPKRLCEEENKDVAGDEPPIPDKLGFPRVRKEPEAPCMLDKDDDYVLSPSKYYGMAAVNTPQGKSTR